MAQLLLNGELRDAAAPCLAAGERGFRFGDGAFETVPVHEGVPYLLPYHLERLEQGLKALRIACDLSGFAADAERLIAANRTRNGTLRIYVSRGEGSRGYLPTLPPPRPTCLMETPGRPEYSPAERYLWLSSYEKTSPRALPVQHKLAQGVAPMLARMEASDQGCHEALLLNAEGHICEAGSANLFWVKGGVLYTPSLACGLLAGVTRRRMIELSPLPVREGAFTLAELEGADCVFLTNATMGVVPIAGLNPTGARWATEAAERFIALRNQDIAAYCERYRR